MIDKTQTIENLSAYQPFDEQESKYKTQIIDFLKVEDEPFSRETKSGHIVSGAFVVDEKFEHILLIYHAKLKKWLQPGGHCEQEDQTALGASQRELLEETGIDKAHPLGLFDLDAHVIPARPQFGHGEHMHYDIRFLFVTATPDQVRISDESESFKWVPISELKNSGLARIHKKLIQLRSFPELSASVLAGLGWQVPD